MNILIIGPYPPPLGGNSVHVQRLHALLQASGYKSHVLNVFSMSSENSDFPEVTNIVPKWRNVQKIIQFALKTRLNTVVHIHVSAMRRFRWFAPVLLLLFIRQSKIITIHSGSFSVNSNKVVIRIILFLFSHIITVNDTQKKWLLDIGIDQKKISVIPAFIPEVISDDPIPKDIEQVAQQKTLVITSGYLTELYNYEILINIIKYLPVQKYHFIFAFYNIIDKNYQHHLMNLLCNHPNVTILYDQNPRVFVKILSKCDIYVRATKTDGDAVAIREALYLGKFVFASDSVQRPDECFLFNGNHEDSLLDLFKKYDSRNLSVVEGKSFDYFKNILNIYYNVSKK